MSNVILRRKSDGLYLKQKGHWSGAAHGVYTDDMQQAKVFKNIAGARHWFGKPTKVEDRKIVIAAVLEDRFDILPVKLVIDA